MLPSPMSGVGGELPPAFLDTPLSEEPAMVKLSMTEIERTAAAVDGPVGVPGMGTGLEVKVLRGASW